MIFSKLFRAKLIFILICSFILWVPLYYFLVKPLTGSSLTEQSKDHLIPGIYKTDGKSISVTVFYETLCPDSRTFVIDQLLPTYQKFGSRVKLDLVPYGKATTSGTLSKYSFTCQHGSTECEGNMYHACVVDRVRNPLTQLQLISCMIRDNFQPQDDLKRCTSLYGGSFSEIVSCYENDGEELLKIAGDRTHSLSPKIDYIPTILLNGDRGNQIGILKNLSKELCAIFKKMDQVPPECDN